ncbi:MAG: hydroxymethylbilane synthase [Clostridiales bacterium]|nr:hydroxymethylbilane synthase [Clostridiales bacterium]
MNITIATRKSKLAQLQTEIVGNLLKEKEGIEYNKLLIVTEGDKRLDVSLDKIGGKGLFTKDVELALINGLADVAVHSMKDVPYKIGEEFQIVAITKREDPRDVFISNNGEHFKDLKNGAKIGTSSVRRGALLKELRPDLEIVPIRGNIQTRLEKMKINNLDGIILASAGLIRLGMEKVITDYFNPMEFLPAIGQGALGVECLKTCKFKEIFKSIDDDKTRISVEAERSFMKALNGDCHSLIGAYSKIEGNTLYLIGTCIVGGQIVKADITGSIYNNMELGTKLAEKLLRRNKWYI